MNILNPRGSILKSLTGNMILLCGLTGFIACSDLETSGITNSDVEQFQSNLTGAHPEGQPLIVLFEDTDLNGDPDGVAEIWPPEEGDILARVKPTYINKITVLKDQSAIDLYGERGQNGVIEITLLDKEQALSDLNRLPPPPPQSASGTTAQTTNPVEQSPPPAPDTGDDFYIVAEVMPKLIGGYTDLLENLNYPLTARRDGVEGTVTVQFIVNAQGEVENPRVIRSIGAGLDEEALRVIRLARFEPGLQDGRPVRVKYNIPIQFRL